MNDGNDGPGRPRRAGSRRVAVLPTALAGIALLIAACGGGGSSSGAASTPYQQAVAYAQCMRSHGEPGFPDPNSQGLFQQLGPVNIHSAQYLAADKACEHLLPRNEVDAAQGRQILGTQLKYAGCLRSHGFPNTPDPVTANGNVEGVGPGGAVGPGSGIDTNSPQYKSAQQACLPFLAGAGS
jgi:hypothetical protein